MTGNELLQIAAYLAMLLMLVKPLGTCMATIYRTSGRKPLDHRARRVERYRIFAAYMSVPPIGKEQNRCSIRRSTGL